jgi:glutamate-ammonia-ligase adenylyltransferase
MLSQNELASRYGLPDDSRFAILGLGKLGGGELGYGSDLDILFIYEKEGSSRGGLTSLSHREYFCKLADRTMKILTMITKEGAAYKVDTRLRPGGQKGELVQPLSTYEAYFSSSAEVWERQAYLKLRPVAGDLAFGDHVLNRIRPLLFRDEENLAAKIAAMRKRMEEERAKGGVHVKLGSGGVVDIEFIAQFLQLQYGRERPELWKPGTLQALEALAKGGYLSEEAADQLGESYRFLRRVEERLRIAAGLNTGTLPQSKAKLRMLARRLGYEGDLASERFSTDYAFHTQAVRKLYGEVFHA